MAGCNGVSRNFSLLSAIFFGVSFVIGIGAGSSILIGQAYGARNEERVKAIVC
ncbi:MATE family efflux transporter [Desulfoscipio gibsoniae]|uniref:MATE family efflux transporter n=1 Tax=Desulfoscipio gibsoniae TaxID=102134 RepID=UPI00307FA67D